MKSGTSYLQAMLRRNEETLRDHGVLVETHLLEAVGEVRGREGKKWAQDFSGQWSKMMARVDEWQGHSAVLSQEFLAAAKPREAKSTIAGLGDHEVTVVVTARDLLRIIPSHWQTIVRSNSTMSFPEFVDAVLAPRETRAKRGAAFWRAHDLARTCRVWGKVVGPENVVIVTLPQPGAPSDVLWQRFLSAIDVMPSDCNAEADLKSNVSLSYSQVEMLRDVNARVRGSLSALEYRALVWRLLASKILQRGPVSGDPDDRPRVVGARREAVVDRADVMLAEIESMGMRVVGDLDDLRIPRLDATDLAAPEVEPMEPVSESASFAVAKLVLRIAELERELGESGGRSDDDGSPDDGSPDDWLA